jgi:hypothetical protein
LRGAGGGGFMMVFGVFMYFLVSWSCCPSEASGGEVNVVCDVGEAAGSGSYLIAWLHL